VNAFNARHFNVGCGAGAGDSGGESWRARTAVEVFWERLGDLTPLYEAWVGRQPHPKGAPKHISGQIPPEGRMTTAAEIAAAVVFLLSSTQSGSTTAQHFIVDGGYVHLDRMLTAKE
jgi:NAD(P)-dependent dehydrogenase (short-subunit alcohol dehydrogenase family)